MNQLTLAIDPLASQTSFTYDGNGNVLSLQDALAHTTVYTYDSMDRVATRTDPLTHYETHQYDANGNPTVFVDRKNQVGTNTYDALDRLKQITYNDSSTITYTYDAGNRLMQIVDSVSGTITRTYDGLNRLTNETTPQGSVSYTYDNANRRSSMTVYGQTAVSYTYDNANRLTQITQGTPTVTIGYDNANRRTSLTLPNGISAAYTYDNASRLLSITYTNGGTTVGDLSYTYDANGRRITMAGSLATVNLPAAISSATYNANNQLTNWNGTTLSYDLNGNMTSDGTNTHTWNARNQLSAFSSTSFAYDAFGRRIQNAAGKAFLYDGVNAVQEITSGTVTANLLTGLGVDETFTRTDSSGARNFLTDGLGSTLALTDSSGTSQTQYAYEPFGKTTAGGSSSANTFEYTGRENDGTGLFYYRARYYNPTLQRFVSEDPIGFGAGVNTYAFVFDNPIVLVDPSGLAPPPGGMAPGSYPSGVAAGQAARGTPTASPAPNLRPGPETLPGQPDPEDIGKIQPLSDILEAFSKWVSAITGGGDGLIFPLIPMVIPPCSPAVCGPTPPPTGAKPGGARKDKDPYRCSAYPCIARLENVASEEKQGA